MESFKGHQSLVRIYISETDTYNHQPLYQALMQFLKDRKIAGCTVLRAVAGFGAKSHLHSAQLLRLSQELPLVIEIVETRDKVKEILPEIDEMISDGLVTIENVEVIRYAPKK